MLTYNNHLKKLVLPEYGRNIQNMVDHCLTIPDREERTNCAHTIVRAMMTLFPQQGGDRQEYTRKLWDHLAIMSDFRLDVDIPFELVQAESFAGAPEAVDLSHPEVIRHRHYGLLVQQLIEIASQMEPGEERDELAMLIANHMKKLMLAVNRDGVDDARVFNDLRTMSHGVFNFNPAEVHLHEFKAAPMPTGKKKKKK